MKKKVKPFTAIENDLFEKIIETRFKPSQKDVLLVYVRLLNGFHKTEDNISISQIMKMTTLSNRSVIDAQRALQAMNILILVEKGISKIKASKWKLNKNIATWEPVNTTSLVKSSAGSYEQLRMYPMNTCSHTKETKETKERVLSKDEKKKRDKEVKARRKDIFDKMKWSK